VPRVHWSEALLLGVEGPDSADPARDLRLLVGWCRAAGVEVTALGDVGRLVEADRLLQETLARLRAAKERDNLEALERLLAAPVTDQTVSRYVGDLHALEPWLAVDLANVQSSLAVHGVKAARQAVTARAQQALAATGGALEPGLQRAAREAVQATRAVLPLPGQVWQQPSWASVLGREGRAADVQVLLAADERFGAATHAAVLLRRVGATPGHHQLPGGAPRLAWTFRGFGQAMEGLADWARVVEPLRLAAAVERGFDPGVWSVADLERAAAPAKRRLFGLIGA
jgi:hypothetical protein